MRIICRAAVNHVLAMVLLSATATGWLKPDSCVIDRDRTSEQPNEDLTSYAVGYPPLTPAGAGFRGVDINSVEDPNAVAAATFFFPKRNRILSSEGLSENSCSCPGSSEPWFEACWIFLVIARLFLLARRLYHAKNRFGKTKKSRVMDLGAGFVPRHLPYMECEDRPCFMGPFRCQPLKYSFPVVHNNSVFEPRIRRRLPSPYTSLTKDVVVGCICSPP